MHHEPVMIKEVMDGLDPKADENFIDCTLGDGGHALEILKRTAPDGKILAFELDEKALAVAEKRLKDAEFEKRIIIINDNFRNLKKYAGELPKVNGILADLGLRSGQLEDGGGGFSFKSDEPLDMRFGREGKSAADIINNYSTDELSRIFREYGEEKNHRHIAKAITEARRERQIATTGELVEIILAFYRRKLRIHSSRKATKDGQKKIPWVGGIHPATKIFQALRIEANDELGALKQLLNDGVDILSSGGRFAIISYHSLEDRIVKRFYRTSPRLVILAKKPITPSEEEAQKNRRARSAKLRVAKKIYPV